MKKTNVLVIGSGGREHAIARKLRQSPGVDKIFCAPGNAGMASLAELLPIRADDFEALSGFVEDHGVGLTVVGPEAPLAAGIADYFMKKNLKIFGPNQKSARLESSKVFSKDLMKKYRIPTASYDTFTDYKTASEFIEKWPVDKPVVVKADGLAAGKGVYVCKGRAEAQNAVKEIMSDKLFGGAGAVAVVEEFLDGEEASIHIFLDGTNYKIMVSSQDHKRVNDGDLGPNTGGMGAYAPAPVFDDSIRAKLEALIIKPLIAGFKNEGIDYKGVLYIGLMICAGEPYVLEFNCRFGDPETQVVLPLLKTDLLEIMEKTVEGRLDNVQIEWYNKSAVCIVMASGGYPGSFKKGAGIKGLDKAAAIQNSAVFHAGTNFENPISDDKIFLTAGGRVLGAAGWGDNIKDAVNTAYKVVSEISFDGMHFRKDIAKRALERVK